MENIGNELQKYIDIDYYYFIENIVDEYVALFDEKTLAREDMYEFIIYENKNFVIDNEKLKKLKEDEENKKREEMIRLQYEINKEIEN